MKREYVVFNGMKMVAEWPAKILEAQAITSYVISGHSRERIRYGDEATDWNAAGVPCHDCGVVKSQYHVPAICDVEECPACGGQVISCDCS